MYRVRQEGLPFAGSSYEFVGAEQGDVGVSVFLFNGLLDKGPGPHRHPRVSGFVFTNPDGKTMRSSLSGKAELQSHRGWPARPSGHSSRPAIHTGEFGLVTLSLPSPIPFLFTHLMIYLD